MSVHENVILDLLPAVRGGHASAESRALVEEYLQGNPKLATYAALMPTPDPELELRTLQRTRQQVGRSGWMRGLAITFTLLPFSFVVDEHGSRLLFASQPALMVTMAILAAAFWTMDFRYHRRWSAPQ
jgi:hypothetical protein